MTLPESRFIETAGTRVHYRETGDGAPLHIARSPNDGYLLYTGGTTGRPKGVLWPTGQSRRVQVHKFVAIGTLEERIDKMLSEKTQLAETIVGAGDQWLTEMSTSELKNYLMLSEQAVGEF